MLKIYGEHDDRTLAQMQRCMETGSAARGVLCADGHTLRPFGVIMAGAGEFDPYKD